jgi:hypothetical protein
MIACLAVCYCAAVNQALAEDAAAILDRIQAKQMERSEGVNCYLVDQTVMGHRDVTLYERTALNLDGKSFETFRAVPQKELDARQGGGARVLTPEELEVFAGATERTGAAVSSEMDRGMQEAGLPEGFLGALGAGAADEPWASPDAGVMMGSMAQFLRASAAAQVAGKAESAEGAAAGMEAFRRNAKLVGTEKVAETAAFHLRADNLNHRQQVEGGEFVLDTIDMWVDKKMYVPLKMTMKGEMAASGKQQAVQIEKIDRNYQGVPGSRMYESREQVMRLGGVMTPEQQKQMKEAQAQLADFRKQMAAMPKAQQDMMKNMMGPQLEMMEKMAESGAFEVVTKVNDIRVVKGPDCGAGSAR